MLPDPSNANAPCPVRIVPADIPGLFDVEMSDGTWRNDLTTGQVRYLTDVVEHA